MLKKTKSREKDLKNLKVIYDFQNNEKRSYLIFLSFKKRHEKVIFICDEKNLFHI